MSHPSLIPLGKKFVQPTSSNSSFIAIDFGRGNSTVGFCKNGQAYIIPNDIGRTRTPNYVKFDCYGETIIGNKAKHQRYFTVVSEPCIFDVGRMVGKTFSDPSVQECIQNSPFQVVQGNNDRICIKISEEKMYSPEEIVGKILSHLKKCAENYLGQHVQYALMTVPLHFNDSQRQGMEDACSIAGLDLLRIIDDPVAATIAYNFKSSISQPKIVMVFDLRKHSFDTALLKLRDSDAEVLSSRRGSFGAERFVTNLVGYCVKQFQSEEGIDLQSMGTNNRCLYDYIVKRRLLRLRFSCARARNSLATARLATVTVQAIDEEHDMRVTISNDTFNSLNEASFEECMQIAQQVIEDAKLNKDQIDHVILLGSTFKYPELKKRIVELCGKTPLENVKTYEAKALGAAMEGSKIFMKPFYPSNIGAQIFADGMEVKFTPIISKNSQIPCRATKRFGTLEDNQTSIWIWIFEGENKRANGAHLLGKFELQGLPENSAAGEPIDITLEIKAEGVLVCEAVCPRNSARGQLVVTEGY